VNAYLIIGEPGTRKSSLLRSLTGCFEPERPGYPAAGRHDDQDLCPGFDPAGIEDERPGFPRRGRKAELPQRHLQPAAGPEPTLSDSLSGCPDLYRRLPRGRLAFRPYRGGRRPFDQSGHSARRSFPPGRLPARSISLPRISGPTSSGTDAAITSGISMRYLAVVHIPVEDSFPGCSRDDRPADRTSTSPEYRYRPLRLNRHQKDKPMKSGRR